MACRSSPTAVLIGSVAFGILFLLAWQFVPPALGVPSYIIPTVSDLAREFGRMAAREHLTAHILSTVTIATAGFVIRQKRERRGRNPVGKRQVNFRLRDWGISRQRY